MTDSKNSWPGADTTRKIATERQELLNESGQGYCILQVLFDRQGKPTDYRFLDTNPAFEEHTGLVHAVGKTALELVPDLEYAWIERYAHVASTGQHARFVQGSTAMERWFEVDAFRVGDPEDHHVALLFREISERIRAEERVHALLEEKQLLLRETHHRIKNNMHVIQSLLSLEARKLTDATSQRALQGASGKIRSMMVLYDRLYRSEMHGEATLREFLPPLVEQIVDVYSAAGIVDTRLELDDISLHDHQLSTVGILVNELISNSMKYAFEETKAPQITLSAQLNGDVVMLTYGDNGSGLPESVVVGEATDETAGFGIQLIGALAQQLKATVRVERDSGTRIVLEFAP